jgi:hypothetical protein
MAGNNGVAACVHRLVGCVYVSKLLHWVEEGLPNAVRQKEGLFKPLA